jgi:tRNA dimethylallyltransferase
MRVIVVAGPTAVGKTDLTIELAGRVKGEIINMDSVQVYDLLDIGSAKPAEEEFKGVPHHLFGTVDPFDEFSVRDYQVRATALMEEIHSRGRVPVLSGGTGLYLSALYYQMDFNETPQDPALRKTLHALAEEEGKGRVHGMLEAMDPESAARIHPNNLKRVIRQIEILKAQMHSPKSYRKNLKINPRYQMALVGLTMDRKKLYERINARVGIMLEKGLVDEVKYLKSLGLDDTFNSMKGIGYREILSYLRGEISYETTVAAMKQNSRRYAKRQLTWFKQYEAMVWFSVDTYSDQGRLLKDIEGRL